MADAWCHRDGVIGIGQKAPEGSLLLRQGESEPVLQEAIARVGRLAYDNTTWLVPGVPEADDDDAALEAAIDFIFKLRLRCATITQRQPRPLHAREGLVVIAGGRA
ncbi:hypothetical protein KPL78_16860 [Roseomonas sp. HJA6]|uniref:Uncharacterized protein n=1 Tax=Roseomonas alba TaxID=2846776 RepID=A0ABS7AB85_9PROT|nr:hypothetical protein [Neoroseomonas alba]MBW6399531.1 hypothetical protein [Neoroseomonas alba]